MAELQPNEEAKARERERLRAQHEFEQNCKLQAEAFATFCSEHFKALMRSGFRRHEAMDLVQFRYEQLPDSQNSQDWD